MRPVSMKIVLDKRGSTKRRAPRREHSGHRTRP